MSEDRDEAARLLGDHVANVLPEGAAFILLVLLPTGRCATVTNLGSGEDVRKVMERWIKQRPAGYHVPPQDKRAEPD